MKKKYAWSRNKTDDIWYGGICDSVKECVEEAKAEAQNSGGHTQNEIEQSTQQRR